MAGACGSATTRVAGRARPTEAEDRAVLLLAARRRRSVAGYGAERGPALSHLTAGATTLGPVSAHVRRARPAVMPVRTRLLRICVPALAPTVMLGVCIRTGCRRLAGRDAATIAS